jgi:hypothetical protein
MNRIFLYIFILILLFFSISLLTTINKEYYDNNENNRPPGPWGLIGTGKPWYDYPYILHNIEYY